MKKQFSLLLSLALMSSLASPAAAAEAAPSQQTLRVDGSVYQCEQYNIDGSNYFKLRDMAALLNGTDAQFSVSYDSEKNMVVVVTGEGYEAQPGDLEIGGDKSASAVRSAQSVTVDGEEVSDMDAFNLGGNNFFKLRDLGSRLGFGVDYDEAARTMVVTSK